MGGFLARPQACWHSGCKGPGPQAQPTRAVVDHQTRLKASWSGRLSSAPQRGERRDLQASSQLLPHLLSTPHPPLPLPQAGQRTRVGPPATMAGSAPRRPHRNAPGHQAGSTTHDPTTTLLSRPQQTDPFASFAVEVTGISSRAHSWRGGGRIPAQWGSSPARLGAGEARGQKAGTPGLSPCQPSLRAGPPGGKEQGVPPSSCW